jgi:riboflavin biosynthesis pyrimidine reductase
MSSTTILPGPPAVTGPRVPFTVLFDDDTASVGMPLHPRFAEAYAGEWRIPEPRDGRPYTTINFVVSRDGRISYAEPGAVGGSSVAAGSHPDLWLMGLLRARCDAVLMGDGTVRAEPDHVWTPTYLGDADAPAFEWLRVAEGRRPVALHVLCSLTGEIERHWAAVQRDDVELVVATTAGVAEVARSRLAGRAGTEVVAFGDDRVDTAALGRWLLAERDVRSLLCEGGPHLYGSMLVDGAVDDEFVTLSPVIVGGIATSGARRPSLVEGVGFEPGNSPAARPISLRRAGDHLMVRSRIVPADHVDHEAEHS